MFVNTTSISDNINILANMSYNEHLTAGLATVWSCEPGEVASRIAAKRKRTGQENEDIPWTAARCNRLLRTITSRISLLQNDVANGRWKPQGDGLATIAPLRSLPGASKPTVLTKGDPQWLPDLSSKPHVRTYGRGMAKHKLPPSHTIKSNPFATPFVKRLMKSNSTKSPTDIPIQPRFQAPKRKRLPVRSQSSSEESLKNLVFAFGNLLVATNHVLPLRRRGAQSLMSTCLRKVPAYIATEIAWSDDTAADTEDIASSVYADLETLGSLHGGGWSGLREVVRAHATQQVCEAIEGRLLPDEHVAQLFDLCSKHGALSEAFDIAHSWLVRPAIKGVVVVQINHPALQRLNDLDNSYGTLERALLLKANLFQNGALTLSNALKPECCNTDKLVSALVRGPGRYAASAYLSALVTQTSSPCAMDGIDADQNLLEKIPGLLTSIAIAQSLQGGDTTTPSAISTVIHRIALEAGQALAQCHIEGGQPPAAIQAFLSASFLLNIASLSVDQDMVPIEIPAMMKSLGCRSVQSASGCRSRNSFVQFACNVASHVSRFADISDVQAVARVTEGLECALTEMSTADKQALQEIEVDIAFTFAEKTGTRVSDAILARIGGMRPFQAFDMPHVSMPKTNTGFRWEEGLCEWIAATPQRKRVVKTADRYPTPLSDTGDKAYVPIVKPTQKTLLGTGPTPEKRRQQSMSSEQGICSPDVLAKPLSKLRRPAPTGRERPHGSRFLGQRTFKVEAAIQGGTDSGPRRQMPEQSSAGPGSRLPKPLKRARSEIVLGKENNKHQADVIDHFTDELGMMSPACKKIRLNIVDHPVQLAKSMQVVKKVFVAQTRRSLPAYISSRGDNSDDELGI